MSMSTVCLNMIVKNEAHVIRRCLSSVLPFIDHWVIVDTGSTDGTQEVIREFMRDVPGELFDRSWKNFGHNRSEAIALARGRADYLFMIDADEVLELPPAYCRPSLTEKAYALDVAFSGINYGRVCLVRDSLPWRYVGVLHEYLECDETVDKPFLRGPRVLVYTDGGRSQQDVKVKYADDARVLEQGLHDEPGNTRYQFYLAQSYRDSGQPEKALSAYETRAGQGGWNEEVWYSWYSAALLSEQLQQDPAKVIDRYLLAFESWPCRAETLGQLARYCREQKRYSTARLFARRGMELPVPEDLLFLDRSFYEWRCRDEFSVASYWTGDFEDCRRVSAELLRDPRLPQVQRPRVLENLRFAQKALGLPMEPDLA
jgi:tetratricopeptide (TPR) repeat protein